MDKKILIVSVIFILLDGLTSLALDSDREGGDIVTCSNNPEASRYNGVFSLDYIFSHDYYSNKPLYEKYKGYEFAENKSCEEHVDQIQKKISALYPKLGAGLKLFRNSFKSGDGPKSIWFPATRGSLVVIRPEEQLKKLPENCKAENITRIFQRQPFGDRVKYLWDADNYNKIANENPLQCSYLQIHEWLRDFVKNTDRVNDITMFLHSEYFIKTGKKEAIHNELYKLGTFIDIPGCQTGQCLSAVPSGQETTHKVEFLMESYIDMISVLIQNEQKKTPTSNTFYEEFRDRILTLNDKINHMLKIPEQLEALKTKKDFFNNPDYYDLCFHSSWYNKMQTIQRACDIGEAKLDNILSDFMKSILRNSTDVQNSLSEIKNYIASITDKQKREYALKQLNKLEHHVFDVEFNNYIRTMSLEVKTVDCRRAFQKISLVTMKHCILGQNFELLSNFKTLLKDKREASSNMVEGILSETKNYK